MSLTRKLLESLGLESDKVSTIIEAHAETVDSLKSQIEKYKGEAESIEGLRKELNSAQTELESLKASGGDWQKKYEAEHADFELYKSEQSQKEMQNTKEKAYRALLKESGVSEKRIDAILKVTNLSEIEIAEDGSIKDADKLSESIKADWADFITTTHTVGADTQTPPANNNLPRFSHEEIAKMTPEEINNNWDAIKQSMKG